MNYPLSYPLEFGRKIALYTGAILGSVSLLSMATMEEDDDVFTEYFIHIETKDNEEPQIIRRDIKREKIRSEKNVFDEVMWVRVSLEGRCSSALFVFIH